MSEQTEQTSGEPGSLNVGAVVPNSSASNPSDSKPFDSKPSDTTPVSAEAPSLVPEPNAAQTASETSAPELSAPKVEAPKETPKAEAPRQPGKLLIMSPADRDWNHNDTGPEMHSEPEQGGMFGKRRLSALAAVVALAAIAGALGGAMATVGLQQHFAGSNGVAESAGNPVLEATLARIDADIVALKAGGEHTSKMGMTQFNKTSDRLDKLEKAQAESGVKLAKLSEGVEKLHVTPPATPVAAATPQTPPKDVTGSVTTPTATAAAAAPKAEVGRLPVIDNWVLQDVGRGGALIEGRQGVYEVYAGDVIPGLGRIDAVRRQDGRWVVVTSRGLIVAH